MGEMPISGTLTIRQFLGKDKGVFLPYVDGKKTVDLPFIPERVYSIPGYQRGISWRKSNAQVLLKDLTASKKFLGNILLSYSDENEFDIIDGQQRITVIIMILECLKKHLPADEEFKHCLLNNLSFPLFDNFIDNEFKVNEDDEKVVNNDVLNQFSVMKELWNTIDEYIINLKNDDERLTLLDNLLDSGVTVQVAKVTIGDNSSRQVCVDYFIDINNKSVELNYLDILKAYAFKESFESISEQWIDITNHIKTLKKNDIVYPMESLFLHYYLCTINKTLQLKKGLTEDYKIIDDVVEVNGQKYYQGTDIEVLITDKRYYKNMFKTLIEYLKFLELVIDSKSTPNQKICDYLNATDKRIDYTTKANAFTIMSGILKNSDVVPKMLLLKYFINTLQNENRTEDDIKSIYWINVNAVCFSASKTQSKGSKLLAPVVLASNFVKTVKEYGVKDLKAFPANIGVDKEIKQDKKTTTTSGQMLSRRVNVLFNAYWYSENFDVNEEDFKKYSDTQGEYNDEHFLINESGKYSFKYKKQEVTISPNLKAGYVSYLCNYLKIKKEINDEIKNFMVKDKIKKIDEYIASHKDSPFANDYSELLFYTAKEMFEKTNCPTESDLELCTSKAEAARKALLYYETEFSSDFENYVSRIKEITFVIAALRKKNISKASYLTLKKDNGTYDLSVITANEHCIGNLPCEEFPLYRIMASDKDTWKDIHHKLATGESIIEDVAKTELDFALDKLDSYDNGKDIADYIEDNLIQPKMAAFGVVDYQKNKVVLFDSQDDAIKGFISIYCTQKLKWLDMSINAFKECTKNYRKYKDFEIKSVKE